MHIADMLSRLAGKDLDPPDKVILISFNAMQSSQPRRCSPRLKKQAISTHSMGKMQPEYISAYQPQVLLKRQTEILGKPSHISKIDIPSKPGQSKQQPPVPKPQIIYQSNTCNTNSSSRLHTPQPKLSHKKQS